VNRQLFTGTIEIRLDHPSVLSAFKYFCPDIVRQNARQLIKLWRKTYSVKWSNS